MKHLVREKIRYKCENIHTRDVKSIILFGGEVKRLKPYLPFKPTLADIGRGKCLLQYQVEWLKIHDVERVVLACAINNMKQFEKAKLR